MLIKCLFWSKFFVVFGKFNTKFEPRCSYKIVFIKRKECMCNFWCHKKSFDASPSKRSVTPSRRNFWWITPRVSHGVIQSVNGGFAHAHKKGHRRGFKQVTSVYSNLSESLTKNIFIHIYPSLIGSSLKLILHHQSHLIYQSTPHPLLVQWNRIALARRHHNTHRRSILERKLGELQKSPRAGFSNWWRGCDL